MTRHRAACIGGWLLLAVAATSCSKAPAEVALRVGEQAVEAVRAEAERFAPEQYKAVSDALAEAKARFERGDYDATIEAAKELPSRAEAAAKAASARKEELTAAWNRMQETVPERVAALRARLEELTNSRRLPPGLTADIVEQAKAQAEALGKAWTQAAEQFREGDLPAAANRAAGLKSRLEELLAKLNLSSSEKKSEKK